MLLFDLPQNLLDEEMMFLSEDVNKTNYFYKLLVSIKESNTTTIIKCENSYERRIVHILAEILKLYHCRFGEWDERCLHVKDPRETVDSEDGKEYYRINGVKISNMPLKLTKKDKQHQKYTIYK